MKKQMTHILALALLALFCNGAVAITINADGPHPDATDTSRLPPNPIYNGYNKTCPAGQVLTGDYNNQPQCVAVTATCPAGQVMQSLSNGQPICVPPNGGRIISCPAGQVMQGIDNNGNPVCVSASGVGALGASGYYTQVASNAANAYNGSNNTGATQNVYAYSYCQNAASSVVGNVNGVVVAEQENPNPSGANINSIAFAVPPGEGYGVNAYCATGGYINVYTYSYQ